MSRQRSLSLLEVEVARFVEGMELYHYDAISRSSHCVPRVYLSLLTLRCFSLALRTIDKTLVLSSYSVSRHLLALFS